MKSIPLSQGYFAIVNDADYEALNQHKWCVAKCRSNRWYAVRSVTISFKKRIRIYMHREILSLKDENCEVDHIDGNGLNNQRFNIRVSDKFQNQYNVGLHKKNSSGHKGVYWNKNRKSFMARISVKGKRLFLGYFESASDAAKKYNEKAIEHHNEFSKLNKV